MLFIRMRKLLQNHKIINLFSFDQDDEKTILR